MLTNERMLLQYPSSSLFNAELMLATLLCIANGDGWTDGNPPECREQEEQCRNNG